MNASRLRFLVADVAAMDARIRAILCGDDLVFARTTPDVERILDASLFDLAMICERFDDSRAFDLLRSIGEDRRLESLPVVCVRPHAGDRSDGYAQTVYAMGADALVDIRDADRGGAENDRVRRLVYECIDRGTLMRKSSAYTRTLQYACDTVGGRERLAGMLGVAPQALSAWISGAEFPPFEAYSRALDIVAAGPFALPACRDGGAPREELR